MPDAPKLVRDDPWLEPYQAVIEGRMQHFKDTLAGIRQESREVLDATHQLLMQLLQVMQRASRQLFQEHRKSLRSEAQRIDLKA